MQEIQHKNSLKHLYQNLYLQERPILQHTVILFLHEKAFTEKGVRFLMARLDCASIATDLCEIFNTRVLLNIYFRIPHPFSVIMATILFLDKKEKK